MFNAYSFISFYCKVIVAYWCHSELLTESRHFACSFYFLFLFLCVFMTLVFLTNFVMCIVFDYVSHQF